MTADTIRDGMVVSITYTLTTDGQTIDTATAEEPLEYLHGAENIVPGLEAVLTGKRVGDKFNVTLQPEQAFGAYDEQDIEVVPHEDFGEVEGLEVGTPIMMIDEDGYEFEATVRDITDEGVVLDFNPALAGKIVTYVGEVVDIREAEEDELAAGQPYGFSDLDDEDYDDDDE
jgi:FKBP-type peptidyl-prolyl cis-trans isomerase SlyD